MPHFHLGTAKTGVSVAKAFTAQVLIPVIKMGKDLHLQILGRARVRPVRVPYVFSWSQRCPYILHGGESLPRSDLRDYWATNQTSDSFSVRGGNCS